MRPGKPSFTASVVAFGRGVGLGGRRDELAPALLPAPFAQALGLIRGAPLPRPVVEAAARLGTLGLVDHASLRMAAVDEALCEAFEGGAEQMVLLGAGLDTRAWRMDVVGRAIVYEVDHPATQAYKRERVAGLAPRARAVRFVPVDFERSSLDAMLAEAGHRTDRPTVWLWEAVTVYLPRAAFEATLAEVAARSAPGSALLLTYVTPELSGVPFVSPFAVLGFRLLGEPLVGAMTSAEADRALRGAGFEPRGDTGSEDWSRRFGGSARLVLPFASERLVVARSTRR